MCEIATIIAVTSLAATAASGYMAFQGQRDASKAAEDQGRYQEAVANNNATLAERMAVDAEDRGRNLEQEQRLRTRQLIGQERVQFAKGGVRLGDSGTINTEADAAAFGELDALTLRSNAQREAYGYRTQGMNFQSEGALARASGDSRASNLRTQSYGTALSTAGSVGSRWYAFDKAGAFSSASSGPSSNTTSTPHYFSYG